ncbi:hypothetical protein KGQ20_08940 [Catenulispora sp. NF23]|uniref:hypothetical protein n=1 Tax=Catenulispora pinistramenti TaxID=2705254 RepID=UPI001BA9C734|nr:hypothetical protein [Catenulispora pinistramenti]MBS2532899.1 hypothetical protein [Catenulispora pinistramenti]
MSFQALYDEVMAGSERFGHRQHVHLTWLAVRRFGTAEAIAVVSDGIQETARYAGAPQKYHATVSRAWVEVVGYHAAEHRVDEIDQIEDFENSENFENFAASNPALLDKRLLSRFYSSALLASAEARADWVEPDREPFPWTVNR